MKNFIRKKRLLCAVLAILVISAGCTVYFIRRGQTRDAEAGMDGAKQIKALQYSKYYKDDGTLNWMDGKASDMVELCAYENLQLKYSDLNLEEDANEETISRKLGSYLEDYLTDSCEVNGLSGEFASQQTEIMYYELEQEYEFERAVKKLSYGTSYDTVYDYYGMEENEYESYVSEKGIREATLAVIVQAIAEQQGISVTQDDVERYLEQQQMEESLAELSDQYGQGYLYHITLQDKVFDFIESKLMLKKDGE